LASMAQTRAMSKALANKFKWVVVLAGYATTPAEEMNGQIVLSGPRFPFGEHKGKSPVDLTEAELATEQARFQELVLDPHNKYRDANKRLLEAIKAELAGRPVPVASKGDPVVFDGYCARMQLAKEARVIREEQKLGATDGRLSLDQQTAVNDLAVELLGKLKK